MGQWSDEIHNNTSINVVQHHGYKREMSAIELAKNEIVVTTYNIVRLDHKNHKNTSPIFQIKWKRIILDDAHFIQNHKSRTSEAVSNIMGVNRWALSGTPVHNKEVDFYALLRFIKCRPFDDWAVWKEWVGNTEAGKKILNLLIKLLVLRRTKKELCELRTFNLPKKTIKIVEVKMLKEERELYDKVLLFSSSLFSSYLHQNSEKENVIQGGLSLKNKINYKKQQNSSNIRFNGLFKQLLTGSVNKKHIFNMLLRLRQICSHSSLIKDFTEIENLSNQVDGIQNTEYLDLIDTMSNLSIDVDVPSIETLNYSNPIFKDSWLSSKINAVCNVVIQKISEVTEDKGIVVSQWVKVLNLINKQLTHHKVKTVLLNGKVGISLRNKIIEDFNNLKGGPKVLLLSMAGSVGLNLITANHLFIVDVNWNPQVEAQVCDRIYRVGQTKPVYIYKFICKNTIESTIISIQNNKTYMANNLFDDPHELPAIEDLKQIFLNK